MRRTISMSKRAEQYLEYRRELGFALKTEGMLLLQFAKYVDRVQHRGALTTALALHWAQLPEGAAPLYQARRLEVVRCFAKYLAIFEPRTEIPLNGLLGRAHARPHPYIYSVTEVRRILAAARELAPLDGIRPKTYGTLFGLLISTGLRIGEALRLKRSDFDPKQGVLTIVDTKYKQSRLVVLHPSTTAALKRYMTACEELQPCPASDVFFLAEHGKALRYSMVRHTFRGICRRLGIKSNRKAGFPRIYDLRHTFACRCLVRWYRQRVDVEHRIAALSTYMGHAKVTDTYWYITGVPELMEIAARRFEDFHHNQQEEHSI